MCFFSYYNTIVHNFDTFNSYFRQKYAVHHAPFYAYPDHFGGEDRQFPQKKKIPAYSLGWYLLMILLYSDVLFTCLVLLARLCDGTISSQQKRYPLG